MLDLAKAPTGILSPVTQVAETAIDATAKLSPDNVMLVSAT